IRAANDVNSFAFAGNRLGGSTTVIDARALQFLDPRYIERAPLHTCGEKQGVTRNLKPISQLDIAIRPVDANAYRFLRRENLDIEAPRLCYGATREIAPREPRREPKIILDSRTESRLSTGRFTLHHHRAQTFGRAIDGSCEARRSAANDREIVEIG